MAQQPSDAASRASETASHTAGGWLPLGRASQRLGVNESTLRRWADEGRVRSFRTPGGHRRFAEADLVKLATQSGSEQAGSEYRTLGNLALARIRRRLQQGKPRRTAWYSTVDEASRMRFRPLGRRLVALTSEALDGRVRGGRLAEEARAIGREYGEELARDGVTLRDAVEAFTFFRHSLDDTARELAQRSRLSADEAAEAWEHVSGLADVVLVAMIEAFDGSRTEHKK